MRCYCCNKILTPRQATRRFSSSQSFTEMCDECLETIDIDTTEGRGDDEEDVEEEEE